MNWRNWLNPKPQPVILPIDESHILKRLRAENGFLRDQLQRAQNQWILERDRSHQLTVELTKALRPKEHQQTGGWIPTAADEMPSEVTIAISQRAKKGTSLYSELQEFAQERLAAQHTAEQVAHEILRGSSIDEDELLKELDL